MPDFSITLSASLMDGLVWGKGQYEASNVSNEAGKGDAGITDNQYIQWIIEQAAIAYKRQMLQQEIFKLIHASGPEELDHLRGLIGAAMKE